jgi:1-acyl-sn-glycerol-3-phosphate acyltransferase
MFRNIFCVLTAIVWTAVIFPFSALAIIFTGRPAASLTWVRGPWSRVLLWAGGATLEVVGAQHVARDRPYIFVSNHQSTIDIPTLFIAIPADVRFVAKHALKYVPFIGWYMSLARFVFVDRGNTRKAVDSLDKAAAQIRGGVSIIMFPEGTRSTSLKVMNFKKGPFVLAMKAGVPLVPIAIEGSGKLMPKNSWNITPGPIRVSIGAPIDPAQFGDDRDALIRAVRDAVVAQNLALGGLGGDDRPRPVGAK